MVGDLLRAAVAPAAGAQQSGEQTRVAEVDAQADDVDGLTAPGDRDLHAGHERQPELRGAVLRRGESADLVVIGEGEDLDAVAVCALDDGLGRERTVGDD